MTSLARFLGIPGIHLTSSRSHDPSLESHWETGTLLEIVVNYAPSLIYDVISQKVRHGVMLLIFWPNPYGRGRWVPEGWGDFSNVHDAEADLDSLLLWSWVLCPFPHRSTHPGGRARPHMCMWAHLLCTQLTISKWFAYWLSQEFLFSPLYIEILAH